MDLGEVREKVKRLNLQEVAETVLQDQADIILQRQKAQLFRGENSFGTPLPVYKQQEYADMKHARNPVPGYGNPDYYLTGAYYSEFMIEIQKGLVHIFNQDSKAKQLAERTGGAENADHGYDIIYGLNETEHDHYITEDFSPAFLEEVHRDLNL